MSFIDASYFVGDLNIPNTDQPAVAERLAWFITKYEPEFLFKLFGYPLYKAFTAGMAIVPPATPDQRYLDIVYGKEYTGYDGRLRKWRGLVVTNTPVFSAAGLTYRKPEYPTVGTTAGFVAGVNSVVFADWIGWTPTITRNKPMKPTVDYSWDPATGTWTLLVPGDKFMPGETFLVEFELRQGPVTPVIDPTDSNFSCIAHYTYFQIRRNSATQTTDFGETVATADNTKNASPRKKAAFLWNQMHDWVCEFNEFMQAIQDTNPIVYPEWTVTDKYNASRTFGFMNPIF